MTLWQAILMGIVQGLGEFLPISSSGHLVATPWVFGFKDPGLTFDVALHFGTLLAIITFFYKDWIQLFRGVFHSFNKKSPASERGWNNASLRVMVTLVVATLPAAIIGKLLDDLIGSALRQPWLVAINMSVMGAFLLWADKKAQSETSPDIAGIGFKRGVWIGVLQVLALIPGVSRSGVTITTALFLGVGRQSAARYSFLLATPITFGACLLKAPDFFKGNPGWIDWVGIAVSALVGFLSIKYLLRFIQRYSYRVFSIYRFIFSFIILFLYFYRQ